MTDAQRWAAAKRAYATAGKGYRLSNLAELRRLTLELLAKPVWQ